MTELISNFEDMKKLLNQVQTIEETCPLHREKLITFKNIKPFCQTCRKEKIASDSERLSTQAYEAHLLRITTEMLKKDSILYDDTIAKATFQNYLYIAKSAEEEVRNLVVKINERYLTGETFNSLFSGEPGTGKSHLAMSILQVLNTRMKKSVSCLFISFEEVLSLIRDSFNNPRSKYTEINMIDLMGSVDYLVLDDVGSESGRLKRADNSQVYATDFTVKILKRTLERRQNKSTIITTNLSRYEMENLYDKRITSRIYRNVAGNIVKFEGIKDKRIKS